MKTIRSIALLLALTPALLHAQGSLTPPAGPPVASMKTLDQVEARKPIQSLAATAPYTITQPGSYYLTGNITVSTNISAIILGNNINDVTIDLNGFTIESTLATEGTAGAISITNSARITVRNGSIRSGSTVTPAAGGTLTARGFAYAILATAVTESLISGVKVTGMHSTAIYCDANSLVENCQVTHSATGIINTNGLTRGCIVSNCLSTGISTRTAESCSATSLQGNGIVANAVLNCTGISTSGFGLNATTTATNCSGISTSSIGLSANTATNCYGISTIGSGLNATTATNCNGISTNGTGLSATTATNCTGTTSSNAAPDIGLEVSGTANTCRGIAGGGASIALRAAIAIGCTFSGALDVPLAKRFNM